MQEWGVAGLFPPWGFRWNKLGGLLINSRGWDEALAGKALKCQAPKAEGLSCSCHTEALTALLLLQLTKFLGILDTQL